MIVGWNELVCYVVVLDCLFEISRALVVKDVVFGGEASAFQSVNEGLIRADHFAGCAIFHWFLEDSVAVGVHQDHDVLVAAN